MGNYVTVTEVRAFKVDGTLVDLDGYSDADIEIDIALAEAMVESITNDKFYELEDTAFRFDGNGLTRLFFSGVTELRLIDITTVKDFDVDGTTLLDTYIEGDDFVKYDYYLEVARGFPGDSPRRRFGTGGVWPKGQKNIEITGTWGRSVVPPEVKRAVMLLVLERLKPGSTQMTPNHVTQTVWDDFTVTYRGENQIGYKTGFEMVDRLLMSHVNYSGLFNVVPDEKQTYDNPLIDF